MRLAISNIAWDVSEDKEVAGLLQRYSVDAVDIAPGKYFPDPGKAEDAEIIRVRRWWENKGIEITGMQALLFGTSGLNLFGSPEVQAKMLAHLDAVCRIASGLAATRLVFGSPKNRDRSGLADAEANAVAIDFLNQFGSFFTSDHKVASITRRVRFQANQYAMDACSISKVAEKIDCYCIRFRIRKTGTVTILG